MKKLFKNKAIASSMRVFHTLCCYLICGLMIFSAPEAMAQSSPDLLYEARAGDVEAMRELGLRLLKGIRVRVRDIPNGAKWLQKASALGDAESSYQVGRLYEEGIYFGKSKKKAIEYYALAVAQGSEKAQKRLKKLAPEQYNTAQFPQQSSTNTEAKDTPNAGENDDNFLDKLDGEYKGALLVYECELIISDQFEIPRQYRGKNYEDVDLKEGKRAVLSQFKKKTREWYEATNGNRDAIMEKQAKAAILGLKDYSFPCSDRCNFPGALMLCLTEANAQILLTDGKKSATLNDYTIPWELEKLWDDGNTNGTFSLQEQPLFHYTTSVEWKNGLPWKAKARIDFSPAKSRIIKRGKASDQR